MRGKKSFAYYFVILIASALLFFGAVNIYETRFNHDVFYRNIYIDGFPVEGLTREEALEQLGEAWQSRLEEVSIRLFHEDRDWIFDHEDISMTTNLPELVEKAYLTGREGGLFARIKEIAGRKDNPLYFVSQTTYKTDALEKRLREIAEDMNLEPVDAVLSFDPDAEEMFQITREEPGRTLQTEAVLGQIEAALARGEFNFSLPLSFETKEARVTARDFAGKTEKLITFGTDLSKSAPDRTHNIRTAASQFNGIILEPGEILSFNRLVGERTAEKGYRSAPMIVADKSLQNAIGGGVSQASTTLYNAAIRAGLDVIEFRRHSFPVSYIEKGLDTTVNLPAPEIDIKVKNTKDFPVYFRTYYADQKIYFEIYGEPLPDGRTIRIRTEEYETVPAPPDEIRQDQEGRYVTYKDEKYVHVPSRQGYKVRVYREYLEGDKVVETELLDDHYYRPIAGIVYVGVKERPVVNPEQPPANGDESAEG